MPAQNANQTTLSIYKESAWAVIPGSVNYTNLTYLSETLKRNKMTQESKEVRTDANVRELAHVGYQPEGSINFELNNLVSPVQSDASWLGLLIAAGIRSSFAAPVNIDTTNVSLAFVASAGTITRGTGTWATLPKKGQVFKVTGTTANDGLYVVRSATSTALTVTPKPVVDDTDATCTIESQIGQYGFNGTDYQSFLIEKRFPEIGGTPYIYYSGMRVDELALDFTSRKIAQGSAKFIGGDTASTGLAVASRVDPYFELLNCSENIGSIMLADTYADVKSAKFSFKTNTRAQDKLGLLPNFGVGLGNVEVTGVLEAYFENLTVYNHFANHDDVEFQFMAQRALANGYPGGMSFYMPRIKLSDGNPMTSGVNTDLLYSIPFTAQLAIETSPATQNYSIAAMTLFKA